MKSSSFYFFIGIILTLLMYGNMACLKGTTSKDMTPNNNKGETTTKHPTTTANELLQTLKEGNKRFQAGLSTHEHQNPERIKELTNGQNPKCIIVSCSDSRTSPEIVFDQGLGDMFSIRTAGNVMNNYEEGSIEYAVEHLHTPLIIVMGHQGCGAIQALLDHADDLNDDLEKSTDHVSKIIEKLKNEEEEQEVLKTVGKNSNLAVIANVINGVKQLRKSDPILQKAYHNGEINIIGAVYHIDSGEVEFLDF